ncbi:MAG TPA: glycosyltransferase family 2 protein [Dehalococcoidia bacterium]|nr:glycosyltransferase family 2 protein [Dehalococcoidia bacterium]
MPDKKTQTKVIIGLPAYNEARTIAGVVLQAKEYGDTVIVVNDGSIDNTAKIARLAGAEVVEHGKNKGYGAAIQTILAEAGRRNADILVIIDADAQHNPNEIPRLIDAVKSGSDVVIGSRESQKDVIPSYRRFGQSILAKFTNIAARQNLTDTESGFRAYSRKAIAEMELTQQGMAISAEIISEASHKGLKISEVPITVSYDEVSSSQNPVLHGLGNLSRIFFFISERRPLLFFSVIGGILLILGIISGIGVLQIYYGSNVFATGSALLCMLLMTLGMLCIFTGVILNAITKRLGK